MGGGLVIKILTEGKEILNEFKEFILQPQSELEQVRRYLVNSGYRITEENMVLDEGKFYPMMKVVLSNSENSVKVSPNTYYNKDIYFKYGQGLLEGKNEVLKLFLEKEYNTYASILEKLSLHFQENAIARIEEIEAELLSIKEALKYYESE
jgi:tRNA (adenine22-N1)-methyltransferase